MIFIELNLGKIFVIDCHSPYEAITIPETTIITPNYPHEYGIDLDCQVTLTFEGRVSIDFEYFGVDSQDCDDWLEVHDGINSDSPLIGEKLCGDNIPTSPMESSGNSMTLIFHSGLLQGAYIGFEVITHESTL